MNADLRSLVDDVKASIPIEDVIGETVGLRKAGSSLVGLCPFHAEKTPSLTVSPAKGLFYCYGCQAGGDVVRFVELSERLEFMEALERLARRSGKTVPPKKPARPRPLPAPPVRRHDVAGLWRRLALRDDAGERYLAGRGLGLEAKEGGRLVHRHSVDFQKFNVGGSGDAWLDARAREGYRLAFPVRTIAGEVVNLSLRYAGAGAPPFRGKKTLVLPGASTKSAAICRAGVAWLATEEPELAGDEVELLEGGTDLLAAAREAELLARSGLAPFRLQLGAVGKGAAASVVAAFAPAIRGRRVWIRLDADVDRVEVDRVASACWQAGAAEVLRSLPPTGRKDVAEAVEAALEGGRA
jgi:hypothetical protein